jgi:hypothetical protein
MQVTRARLNDARPATEAFLVETLKELAKTAVRA